MRNKLIQILKNCEWIFSSSEINEVKEFIDVDEYGLAFETICSIYYEEKKLMNSDQLQLVEEAGKKMGLPPSLWKRINQE